MVFKILLIAGYVVPVALMVLVGLFLIVRSLFHGNEEWNIQNRIDGIHTIMWGIVPIVNMIIVYGVAFVLILSLLFVKENKN